MNRIVSVSLMIALLAMSAHAMQSRIEIQGHRGCRGNLPENTLPAFQAALDAGIDVLEMDLAVTKDRVLVISHDPHINAEICVNADGSAIENPPLINELTLAEVKTYDCGSIQHPRFPLQKERPGATIPTLDEVFDLVRSSPLPHAQTIGFNIETKIFADHPEYTVSADEFTDLVVKAFTASGFIERITLQSFDPRTLEKAKARLPQLRTVALIESDIDSAELLGLRTEACAISPDYTLLSTEIVERLHAQGFKVIPWTVNDPNDWGLVIDMGVDGIITDYPMGLKRFLSDL